MGSGTLSILHSNGQREILEAVSLSKSLESTPADGRPSEAISAAGIPSQ